ncbi:hypothetical protein GCM10009548_91710 [Streptomyces malaysiensis subsp. malaysiensis]
MPMCGSAARARPGALSRPQSGGNLAIEDRSRPGAAPTGPAPGDERAPPTPCPAAQMRRRRETAPHPTTNTAPAAPASRRAPPLPCYLEAPKARDESRTRR